MLRFFLGFFTCTFLFSFFLYSQSRHQALFDFSYTLGVIESKYVKSPDMHSLINGALHGVLGSLDDFSSYLPPERFKNFKDQTLGHYGGIGVEIDLKNRKLLILGVISGSPAEEVGLKGGDQIVGINGKTINSLDLEESAKGLNGKIGQPVKLSVKRGNKYLHFFLVRSRILVPSVSTKKIDDLLYIRIDGFVEKTVQDVKSAIEKNSGSKAYVIDLRRNLGGIYAQAVELSDIFLSKGVIVRTVSRSPEHQEIAQARNQDTDIKSPVFILIDEESASASEIFTGALKYNNRGKVFGRKSYGKGSVQTVIPLKNKGALKLTVAEYLAAGKKKINKVGIKPDKIINIPPKKYNFKNPEKDPFFIQAKKHFRY